MDEPTVFRQVVEEVGRRGYDPLIHVPAAHSDRYADVLDRCDTHRITIAGRYPDVLGFTATNRVFAIEVKGTTDLLRGVGQALTYQRGSHVSYLAADGGAIENVADVAVSKGIGTIGAGEDGVDDWRDPPHTASRDLLGDVSGQLAYRLRHRESAGSVAAMTLAQPLNFLAPVVAIDARGPMAEDDLEAIIEDEYGFGATRTAIRGAGVLGLLDRGDEHALTDQGELAAVALAGRGITDLEALDRVKAETGSSVVADEYPVVATVLRNAFMGHPEVRSLVEVLSDLDGPIEFPALIERLVARYPNVFLNLFCTNAGRERARGLIEAGRTERIHADADVWRDVVRSNVLSNFVQQLKHIGVLAPETRSHFGMDDYRPEEKPWIPR